MWKNLAEWFGALLVTAAVAVSMFGFAEWMEKTGTSVPTLSETVSMRSCIVVDAGHGGFDGGTVGVDSGVKEDALNLLVANLVKENLSNAGFSVKMTREDGEALAEEKHADLRKRKDIFDQEDVQLLVSVHMNAFPDRSIRGAMAYYMAGSSEGQKLAQCVIDAISEETGANRRLANPGDYYVLRECSCPAVLVECGFLSNSEDERILQDAAYQEKIARAITKGITAYVSGRTNTAAA